LTDSCWGKKGKWTWIKHDEEIEGVDVYDQVTPRGVVNFVVTEDKALFTSDGKIKIEENLSPKRSFICVFGAPHVFACFTV
jgi:hypothetical protein